MDGQNLFHAARRCFGYRLPNFDVRRLAQAVCSSRGWTLEEVRFYTGVRAPDDEPFWGTLWAAKLAAMGWDGIRIFARPLVYRRVSVRLPAGGSHTFFTRQEKGIDVRIAIDVIRMAYEREYDVALLFSQDQDLSEVARVIRVIARKQARWIKIASPYPRGEGFGKRPGIDLTDWIPIDRATYDACVDPRDYRPK
ncbi:MAG: NYN domain-containing protein [Planctomycetes bacterium]|nr:NYN domain-containing protein [Planctomycetota bacterium]